MRYIFFIFLVFNFLQPIFAQNNTSFPINGVDDYNDKLYAFTNATIYSDYKTKFINATLLIKNGLVVQIGNGINIPNDCNCHQSRRKIYLSIFYRFI